MLNCVEVTEICSLELEQPLPIGRRLGLGMHLMMCSGCTNYRKQLGLLRQIAQAYADGRAATDVSRLGESSPD